VTRSKGASRRSHPSLASKRWPPWDCDQWDAELRIVLASVEQIKDPAKRAWQAGRMIELHTQLADIRTEAVQELRERRQTWTQIAWSLGITRGRACNIGHSRKSEEILSSSGYVRAGRDSGDSARQEAYGNAL
jgi:hypothetical protein